MTASFFFAFFFLLHTRIKSLELRLRNKLVAHTFKNERAIITDEALWFGGALKRQLWIGRLIEKKGRRSKRKFFRLLFLTERQRMRVDLQKGGYLWDFVNWREPPRMRGVRSIKEKWTARFRGIPARFQRAREESALIKILRRNQQSVTL